MGDRDNRYSEIISRQLGENGLSLVTGVASMFMLTLIVFMFSVFGYFSVLNIEKSNKPSIVVY